MMAHASNPCAQSLRHKACCDFETSPGNIGIGQPGLQCETVSIKRNRKEGRKGSEEGRKSGKNRKLKD